MPHTKQPRGKLTIPDFPPKQPPAGLRNYPGKKFCSYMRSWDSAAFNPRREKILAGKLSNLPTLGKINFWDAACNHSKIFHYLKFLHIIYT